LFTLRRLGDDHHRCRCRSIPTTCFPSYSLIGASSIVLK
jgi:hypothetical protein